MQLKHFGLALLLTCFAGYATPTSNPVDYVLYPLVGPTAGPAIKHAGAAGLAGGAAAGILYTLAYPYKAKKRTEHMLPVQLPRSIGTQKAIIMSWLALTGAAIGASTAGAGQTIIELAQKAGTNVSSVVVATGIICYLFGCSSNCNPQ